MATAGPTTGVIDSGNYPSEAAAKAAWKPMKGSAPASTTQLDGKGVLKFSCTFDTAQIDRASWDKAVNLDLSACRGIQFDILCRDAEPVSYFAIYFQSGSGWYQATFFPESSKTWSTIVIPRSEMKSEGAPAGWNHIKTVRISAWRSKDATTEFFVKDLRQTGVLGADAEVAVLRSGASERTGRTQRRGAADATDNAVQLFEDAGISCAVLGEAELYGNNLKGASLLVLPGLDSVSRPCTESVSNFMANGGKLLAFPPVPNELGAFLKTNSLVAPQSLPLREANDKAEVLTMAASLAPHIGKQAAENGISRIGRIGEFKGYEEATNGLVTSAPSRACVTKATELRSEAIRLAKEQKFGESLKAATAAQEQMRTAFYRAQEPVTNEFRGFWCHNAFGVEGMSWDEAIKRLAENGFTAILPNMLWGGAAFYDSKVLPVARQAAARGDQIRECLAACRKYGVQLYVWKVDWNLGTAAPKEFVETMRTQKRLQRSSEGKEEPWLCPSHPENQKLEIAAMVEVVRNYDVDGIHFDYIRYPGNDYCFCDGCKERFGRATGIELKNWPNDVLAEGAARQQWLDWRRSNITTVVKAVSEEARAIKPKIKISAAVFRYWNTDRDLVGQDWKLWCEKGYLDFVCPMDYTPSNRRFENMVSAQVQSAGRAGCYPGLGVSSSSSRLEPEDAIEQIKVARKYHTGGFVIFNYGAKESLQLLPKLGMGITRP
jgi:uncharacterized lipoprotein YddW (UPF0748 family)